MEYEKIYMLTILNGGYTNNTNNKRYSVGTGTGYILELEDFTPTTLEAVINDLQSNDFGTWVNEGLVYIDLVELTDDLSKAVAIGNRNGEKAIYDLKKNSEIFL